MISDALRTYWSTKTGWLTDLQVEQDLWLHLLLVATYSQPGLSNELVFWGGSALHMHYLTDEDGHRMRYSEDLDFLRRSPGGIGQVLNHIARMLKEGGLGYSYETRTPYPKAWARIPTTMREEPLKVKFEFNTRERDLALGTASHTLALSIPEVLAVPKWATGAVEIATPKLDSKLRSRYARSGNATRGGTYSAYGQL